MAESAPEAQEADQAKIYRLKSHRREPACHADPSLKQPSSLVKLFIATIPYKKPGKS
jgi:hypothetical protein